MLVKTEAKEVLRSSALSALLVTSFPALFSNGPMSSLCFCLPLMYLKTSLAYTPVSDWQDSGEDHLGTRPFHLCPQGSEVLLDLAQVLFYRVMVLTWRRSRG